MSQIRRETVIAWGAAGGALVFAALLLLQQALPVARAQTTTVQQVMVCDPTASPMVCAHVTSSGALLTSTTP